MPVPPNYLALRQLTAIPSTRCGWRRAGGACHYRVLGVRQLLTLPINEWVALAATLVDGG